MSKKIMIAFPGQGAQYPGMFQDLATLYSGVEWLRAKADATAKYDIRHICDELTKEELTKTENAQSALFFTSYCLFKWLRETYEIEPVFYAGHSLGEISALTATGALEFTDAVELVLRRSRYMSEVKGSGKMAAVIGSEGEEPIKEVCAQLSTGSNKIQIANYNSNTQYIISGNDEAVDEAIKILAEKGYRCVPLNVSGAFHSPYMQEAADRLKEDFLKYNFIKPNFFEAPVISNIDARPYCDSAQIKDRLYKQITSGVLWKDTILYAAKLDVDIIIECGPGSVLKNLVRQISDIPVLSLADIGDRNCLNQYFSIRNGANDFKLLMERCIAVSVCEMNHNYNEDEYQKGVVEPYKQMNELKASCESPTAEGCETIIKYMLQIFKTKGVAQERIRVRLNQVLRESNQDKQFEHLLI